MLLLLHKECSSCVCTENNWQDPSDKKTETRTVRGSGEPTTGRFSSPGMPIHVYIFNT